MSKCDNVGRRNLLGRQPARALLIDVSHPFDYTVCSALCESLENLFAVACGVSGPARIPLVSIFLLSGQPEVLLPLSSPKGNFLRIQSTLKTIQERVGEGGRTLGGEHSCVAQAVYQAIEQFKRQVCTFTQPTISQLEVIVLSCQSGESISRRIEAVADSLHIQHLKRIVCVTLTGLYDTEVDPGAMETSSQSSGASHHSGLSGLVDTLTLDADSLSLENFFKSWLMDCGSDSEHLHLLLPPRYSDEERMIIKCDLRERILNPAQLPNHTAYTLHPESATCKLVFVSTSKAAGISLPIHRIKVDALVPAHQICESVLYGMPLVVTATSCWRVEWEELEKNQLTFSALCTQLKNRDQVLLGQLHPEPPSRNSAPSPGGWFVLLPGPAHSLLLKSVSSRELLLPSLDVAGVEEPAEESLEMVNAVLDQVELLDSFNPLTLDSGLYDSLKFHTRGRGSAQSKKRELEQDPQRGGGPVNKMRGVSSPASSSTFTLYNTQYQQQQQQQQQQHQQQQRARRPLTAFLTQLE